jgi:hypothetical protein
MISGGDWITFNTTVWALIYGMKEVFRIAEGREVTITISKKVKGKRQKVKGKSGVYYFESFFTFYLFLFTYN